MKALLLVAIVLLLIGCRNEEPLRYSELGQVEEHLSIARLKSLCRGASHRITQSVMIEGVITANDQYGEYEQALVIEDESGGIEIGVAGKRLFLHYPIGATLRILCEGLALGDYGGKVILGAPPTGTYITDRIDERDRPLRLHLTDKAEQTPRPALRTIREADLTDVGRYVTIEKVVVKEAFSSPCWCEPDTLTEGFQATTRHLIDRHGDTLDLYLPATTTYASEPIPTSALDCSGILDYFNHRFQLRLVNRGFHAVDNSI